MAAAMKLPVSAGDRDDVFAWLDQGDVERLGGRKLSLGSHGYTQVWDGETVVLLHRWVIGARRRDGKIVDHISGYRMDNRRVNLRFVTASESSSNVRVWGRSGYRGVYPNRKGWEARGKVAGQVAYLGTFADPVEAAIVAHEWRLRNLPGYTGRDIAVLKPAALIAA